MINSLNHIGIAVKSIDDSLAIFGKIFSADDVHYETVENQNVKIASFKVGNVLIELTEPLSDASPISNFIAKRGEGIHHIAFESDSIENDLKHISDSGVQLINDTPKEGAHGMKIAFLHPKSTSGVLIELCQHGDDLN